MAEDFVNSYLENFEALKEVLSTNVFISEKVSGNFKADFSNLIGKLNAKKIFAVSGIPCEKLPAGQALESACSQIQYFTGFSPNPKIEEIDEGAKAFLSFAADVIVGIGGGSAIDTAKCIRHFTEKKVPFIAIPTTAGTGSETTKFAVYYKEGVKQSLEAENVIPDYVFLCGELLDTLPAYQRKCTFLDAYCQCCESAFGNRRSDESLNIAFRGIKALSFIKEVYFDTYFSLPEIPERYIPSLNLYALLCSYCSGRAINYTRTAAPHAMSYKLSALKKIPHGHAVALCFRPNFEMIEKAFKDCREGDIYGILEKISDISFSVSPDRYADSFKSYLCTIGVKEYEVSEEEAEELAGSVNAQRLANNPVQFSREELKAMYLSIGKEISQAQ